MASRLALVILLLGCIGLGVSFPAVATEVSAPQFNAGAANSFATNATTAGPSGFVREGAKVTNLKYVLGSYTATGSAECDGGVWKPVNVAGNCPPVSCSGTSGTAANLKITESKTCEGQYCFFETNDMPDRSNNLEIGKTTADHMFRIVPMGDGYIEFNKCTKTPYWFQRLNGGPQLDMAIPTACEDYSTFINNHPTNAITAEYACRPATFELCARSCSTQTNGSCGGAHGGSFTSTPKADLCKDGTASAVTKTGSRYNWTCNGSNGGTNASCSATVPPAPAVNGYCGSADGDEFDSAPTSNLCSKGTASAVTTNASGYAWTCTGANGGVNASCTAKKPSNECIPTGQPVPEGQTQCPTNECFFQVSGLPMGKFSRYSDETSQYSTAIGDVSQRWENENGESGANLVGTGNYPDSYNGPFRLAANGTFDGMAIGKNTRVQIYAGKNYSGSLLFDQTGPIVVSNNYNAQADYYDDWGGGLAAQFPPSSRYYSNNPKFSLPPTPYDSRLWRLSGAPENLFGGYGPTSIKVTCENKTTTDGTCGSSNGGTFSSAPASGLCTTGTAGSFSSDGNGYRWTCRGTNGGANASCSAFTESSEPPDLNCCQVRAANLSNPTGTNYTCSSKSLTPPTGCTVSSENLGHNGALRYYSCPYSVANSLLPDNFKTAGAYCAPTTQACVRQYTTRGNIQYNCTSEYPGPEIVGPKGCPGSGTGQPVVGLGGRRGFVCSTLHGARVIPDYGWNTGGYFEYKAMYTPDLVIYYRSTTPGPGSARRRYYADFDALMTPEGVKYFE